MDDALAVLGFRPEASVVPKTDDNFVAQRVLHLVTGAEASVHLLVDFVESLDLVFGDGRLARRQEGIHASSPRS